MCVCESDPEPRLTFVKEEERQRSCTLFYKIKNWSKAIQSLLRLVERPQPSVNTPILLDLSCQNAR